MGTTLSDDFVDPFLNKIDTAKNDVEERFSKDYNKRNNAETLRNETEIVRKSNKN